MPGYVIANVWFRNSEKASEYSRQVPATVLKYGGRYLVRGGQVEVAEGDWSLHRLVVIEFPSLEQARRWYESDEYDPIKAIRLEHAECQLVFVEGLQPS